MRVGPEPLDECYTELDALLHDYFAKTIAKEGMPPLRMNWIAYIQSMSAGRLVLVTARDDEDKNKLLGFVMYHVHTHLHHIGTLVAGCDIIAVSPEARGRGIATNMMEIAEPLLDARGAHYIVHGFRTCYDDKPLFPKLGYELIEHSYMKGLK